MNLEQLLSLDEGLTPREREAVRLVGQARMATHSQIGRLTGYGLNGIRTESSARSLRRMLARLTDNGVLARYERRIGGVRAGSAGHVYCLGPHGQTLVCFWAGRGLVRGRSHPEPSAHHMKHRLTVTGVYVALKEAEQGGQTELLGFDFEPDCWRRYSDPFGGESTLKPDAFASIASPAYEDRYFIEVDLGTEGRATLLRKLRAYIDYFHSGIEQDRHEVFPRVIFIVNSEDRKAVLVDAAAELDADYWALFTITTGENAIGTMLSPV
jgi:hypothetical protein